MDKDPFAVTRCSYRIYQQGQTGPC